MYQPKSFGLIQHLITGLDPSAFNLLKPSPFHKLPQRLVDLSLIALTFRAVGFEPIDDIGIQAQGELFFYGAIEKPAFRAAPIALLFLVFHRLRGKKGARIALAIWDR